MSEERFIKIAKIYSISHFIAGTLYIPLHIKIVEICNFIGNFIGLKPLPLPSEKFWFSLSVSMMYMITYSAYLTSKKFFECWKIIILSKGASTALFLTFFFLDNPSFAYIAGIIVDFPLFLIALLSFQKIKK